MRTNPALISRLEALNPEMLDYKNRALISPLLCLLKSNCQQKVKCYGNADWGDATCIWKSILLLFILYCHWFEFLYFLKTRQDLPLTRKLGVLTEAFGDQSVTLLELQMFQSLNEKDEIYLPFVDRAKFQKKGKIFQNIHDSKLALINGRKYIPAPFQTKEKKKNL